MRVPAHPGLYEVEAEVPSLIGTRCSACGRVYFPPLPVGCEVCGASEDRLDTAALEARGVIYSLARVYVHQGAPEAPFTIAEIQLDGGPLIRGTLSADAGELEIGQPVSAVWAVTRTDASGDEIVEPAFVGVVHQ
jgi:uncharacterized OB-fold protein